MVKAFFVCGLCGESRHARLSAKGVVVHDKPVCKACAIHFNLVGSSAPSFLELSKLPKDDSTIEDGECVRGSPQLSGELSNNQNKNKGDDE